MSIDDVAHALRRIRSKPATVIGAATMLALAIALTTAMFAVVDVLLLRPMPFPEPDRIARVAMLSPTGGRLSVSPAVFRAWRESAAFDAVESEIPSTVVIEGGAQQVARVAATVTPGVFNMLSARAIRGRLFDAEDGRAGTMDRVVLSEDVWRSVFGSAPDIIGRRVMIDGEAVQIVGVLPGDFRFPQWNTAVWRPIQFESAAVPAGQSPPMAFVRFAKSMPQADALRLATAAARQADATTAKLEARPAGLAGLVLDPFYQRALPLLFGGVALVFLVLCANASSLLLVRLSERRREFSMCAALGASRARLLREALFESAMLGALGSLAGIALSAVLIVAARAFLPQAFLIRSLNPLDVDVRALAAAVIAGAVATIITGLWPAWLGTRRISVEALKTADRTITESRSTRLVARGVVIMETTLACTLMVGAVLLVRSFVNLSNAERGLDTEGVVAVTISLPRAEFANEAARVAMTSAIETEMKAMAGVTQAALSYGIPPDGGVIHFSDDLVVDSYEVGQDFFDLYRIPILRGRAFESNDGARTVIIGERLAEQLWPQADPVGRTFVLTKIEYQVVGVAREINHPSLDSHRDRPEFYQPIGAATRTRGYFMISLRCNAACPDDAAIRRRLRAVHPAISVVEAGPLDAEYFAQLAAPRAAAALAFTFATIGVIAAAGGLFGVLSYVVGRRRREFGIRAALGASQRQIRHMVFRDGVVVGGAGIVLGSLGGWWLTRGLASLQYGITGSDPVLWFTVVAVLALTTIASTWRPARQAACVDPATLLRSE